jgi:hypothetical protein
MALGVVWYSKYLFGVQFMQATGITEEGSKHITSKRTYVLSFITSLVIAGLLRYLFVLFFIGSALEALGLVLIIWLGFSALLATNAYLYSKRSWTLFFIEQGHHLAFLVGAALILMVFI